MNETQIRDTVARLIDNYKKAEATDKQEFQTAAEQALTSLITQALVDLNRIATALNELVVLKQRT